MTSFYTSKDGLRSTAMHEDYDEEFAVSEDGVAEDLDDDEEKEILDDIEEKE